MKLTFALSFFILSSVNVYSSTDLCKITDIRDVVVFTTSSIEGLHSDFQGTVVAGGDVYLQNFYLNKTKCYSLVSNGIATMAYGSVEYGIEGQNGVTVLKTGVTGPVRSNGAVTLKNSGADTVVAPKRPTTISAGIGSFEKRKIEATANVEQLNIQMHRMTAEFFSLARTTEPKIINNEIVIEANTYTNVVELDAEKSPIRRNETIVIRANVGQKVIINVKGKNIELRGTNVVLQGSVTPSDIVWNFVDAETMYIINTADAVYGIPGTVLAPHATVEFYEGLITGALYARSIIYIDPTDTIKTGQINDGRMIK